MSEQENQIATSDEQSNKKTPQQTPQQPKQNKKDKELSRASSLLFDHIEGQINLADTKAQLMLAADALLALAFAPLLKSATTRLLANSPSVLDFCVASFTIVMFLALVGSFYCALLVVRPYFRSSQRTTLMYFGHIARSSEEEFISKFLAQSLDELKESVLIEVHAKAKIAKRKFERIRHSVDLLIVALVLWTVVQLLQAFGR
jgi:Family of unknown function (DUF5706)